MHDFTLEELVRAHYSEIEENIELGKEDLKHIRSAIRNLPESHAYFERIEEERYVMLKLRVMETAAAFKKQYA